MKSNVYSLNTEQSILANLIQDSSLIDDLKISPEMFQDQSAANVLRFILERGEVNIQEIYQKSRSDHSFMSTDMLGALYNTDEVTQVMFKNDQQDLLEQYKSRRVQEITREYIKTPMTKQERENMQSEIESVNNISMNEDNKLSKQLLTFVDDFLDDKPKQFIKTGLSNVDAQIYGFEPTQLIVIGARPGAGKTAIALNMMYNIARNGYPVSFFSLETTDQKILSRLVSSTSGVSGNKIDFKNDLSDKEVTQVMSAIDRLSNLKSSGFQIIDSGYVTMNDIRRVAKEKHDKPQVIFIDYLQLIKVEGSKKDRRLEIDEISRNLKLIAKENNCVIVALSQLSRGVESRQDKRPTLSDLKESGGIEQDSNMVMFLYREDYYDTTLQDDATGISEIELNVAKNRDGSVGTVLLNFHKFTQKYTSKVI